MLKRMYLIFIVIVIVIVIVGFAAWWLRGRSTPMQTATLTVGGHEFMVEVADTIPLRERGLSGRENLEDGRGMLFVFGAAGRHAFWMRGMKIPLDFIWIKDGRVVGVTENVPPPSGSLLSLPMYYPPSEADKVLEVAAGTVARVGVKVGDGVQSR
jgi:uncharacterized membrane protein (UPF0127 family)